MDNSEEIIRSPEFHFLVGPDHQRPTVHTGLVQNLSPPWAALMNNGRMKESLSGTAVIEDIEEATFIAFCEFGYRGRYKTPSRDDKENGDDLSADDGKESKARDSEPEPQSEPRPQPENTSAREGRTGRVPLEHMFLWPSSIQTESDFEPAIDSFFRSQSANTAPKKEFDSYSPRSQRKEYLKSTYDQSPEELRWIQFRSLKFTGDEASPSSNPDLLAHAKICVFATRYLIESLREQSLKSLHRDLCAFRFGTQKISHILDLLEYTFQNTGRREPGGCYSLRKLGHRLCRMQGEVFD